MLRPRSGEDGCDDLRRQCEQRDELQTAHPHLEDVEDLKGGWHAWRGEPSYQAAIRHHGDGLEDGLIGVIPVGDTDQCADHVGHHVEDEHRGGFLDRVRREDAASDVVVRFDDARRIWRYRLLHRLYDGFRDDADAIHLDAACRGSRRAAHGHEERERQERAAGEDDYELVRRDDGESRCRERGDHHVHAAPDERRQVREQGGCGERCDEHGYHHGDPDERGAAFDIPEE